MGDHLHFIFLFLLLESFTGVSAVVDFTCITKPRIDIDSDDTYIAAYLHGSDAELSFARTTFTRTGTDTDNPPAKLELPSNRSLETPQSSEGDQISILRLPADGGKTRIGAFACKATRDDINIGTVIMSKNADFLPTRVSQTVYPGDAVNLTVTARDPARANTRWRKDGGAVHPDRNDHLYFDFNNTAFSNGGVYEVHLARERSQGNQALMRLIVRAVGINRFGQSGSFRCDSPELGGGPTCAGMLFCLTDPYGCSCAAGYQGIDCNERCLTTPSYATTQG
ncbi:tyrosine-protein kinase receptor Tie-1-like [Patiria miniata]|uniref:Uncharacterized protein n=1 Tax=Patiria miniata TaxID=46514 RepID=A0A914ASA1_PATMI|nr:tyrosine-protein kinase receptor Tie-1-like [Patiria miniata]